MVGEKGNAAAKLRENFTQTMINIHCICYRLALAYKGEVEFLSIIELTKIASIVPFANAWLERGASAVKRIKSQMRSPMKNDLLNGILHISVNGPPFNSKEADNLLMRVVDKYVIQRHYKAPTIYTTNATTNSSSTHTGSLEITEEIEMAKDIDIPLFNFEEECMRTNFEDNLSNSEGESGDEE